MLRAATPSLPPVRSLIGFGD